MKRFVTSMVDSTRRNDEEKCPNTGRKICSVKVINHFSFRLSLRILISIHPVYVRQMVAMTRSHLSSLLCIVKLTKNMQSAELTIVVGTRSFNVDKNFNYKFILSLK